MKNEKCFYQDLKFEQRFVRNKMITRIEDRFLIRLT